MKCPQPFFVSFSVAVAMSVAFVLAPALEAQQVNVAPQGVATQSSNYPCCGGFPAPLAIDGNLGNFTATAPDDVLPTWEVDLRQPFSIETIVLHNRDNCCPERLRDITVFVLDAAGVDVEFESDLLNPLNELVGPPELTLDLVALTGGPIDGQIVRVVRTPDPNATGDDQAVMSLGEVEVYIDAADAPIIITSQPVGGRVEIGNSFEFSVAADGPSPLSFQWKKDGVELPGATDTTLLLENLSLADSGVYTVVVSGGGDEAESAPAELVVTPMNLARRGEAYQSSTGSGGAAVRAIDGNTDGNYNAGSVSHTAVGDIAPWWEVLLPGDTTIEAIVIWNRTDCCGERLTNFRVAVLDVVRDDVYEEILFEDLQFPNPSVELTLPANTTGRFVRIEPLDRGADVGEFVLSLAEVEVFGDGPSDSRRPLARQSSDYGAGQFPASLAIDGNFGNFTATAPDDPAPTWELVLPTPIAFESVVIHNRGDGCCQSRLRDITFSVLAGDVADPQVVFQSDLLNPENELGGMTTDGPPELPIDLIAETGGAVVGTILRITRNRDDDLSGTQGEGNADEAAVLSIGEVEYVGFASDCPTPETPEFGDTECLGLLVQGPADNQPGIYEVRATGIDGTGDVVRYTMTAEHEILGTVLNETSPAPTAKFNLTPGEWTFRVTVDDDFLCPDSGDNASCEETLIVAGDVNIAGTGVASQTTDYDANLTANRAIDGNFANFTATAAADPAPHWQVDLGSTTPIGKVVLHNRGDGCCQERLRDITVFVLDAAESILFESDLLNSANELLSPANLTVDLVELTGGTVSGQIVRVARTPDPNAVGDDMAILSLGEVEVFRGEAGTGLGPFRRGDCNQDAGINLADPIFLLNFLFGGGPAPDCRAACDANTGGQLNISTPIYQLNFLFSGGPEPPSPFKACGLSERVTDLALGCENAPACAE